jgi:hypothetical protein
MVVAVACVSVYIAVHRSLRRNVIKAWRVAGVSDSFPSMSRVHLKEMAANRRERDQISR